MSAWWNDDDSLDNLEEDEGRDIGTCQGCGRYGWHGDMCIRNGEECGEFL